LRDRIVGGTERNKRGRKTKEKGKRNIGRKRNK
jgi:hypothetical protein